MAAGTILMAFSAAGCLLLLGVIGLEYFYHEVYHVYIFPLPPSTPPPIRKCVEYTTKGQITLEIFNVVREVPYSCTNCSDYKEDKWFVNHYQRTHYMKGIVNNEQCNECTMQIHVSLFDNNTGFDLLELSTDFTLNTSTAEEWKSAPRRVAKSHYFSRDGTREVNGLFHEVDHLVAIAGPGLRDVPLYSTRKFSRVPPLSVGSTWRTEHVFTQSNSTDRVSFNLDVTWDRADVTSRRVCDD